MDNLDIFDLEQDIDALYELMNDDTLNKKREEKKKLNKLRNNNHKRYYAVNLVKLKSLPKDFDELVSQVEDEYKKIVPNKILSQNKNEALNTKLILDEIDKKIKRIERMIKTLIKSLEQETEEAMSSFSIVDFNKLEIDAKQKRKVINLYNELVVYNSIMEKNIYEQLKQFLNRKKYIEEIKEYILIGNEKKQNLEKKEITKNLNKELDRIIEDTSDKIQYLSDLMIENSNYEDSFNDFVGFYNKIISYDDTNYENVKQTLDILKDDSKFNNYVKIFEEDFINEREQSLNEEDFIYKKIGIRNIKIILDYISANYVDILDTPRKRVIEDTYERLDSVNVDISSIINNIETLVKYIWKSSLTGIDNTEEFCMLCCREQLIETKIEGYLFTRNILNRMNNYKEYKIGYICDFTNNILSINENNIPPDKCFDDLSRLKTPKQIEQEFVNFNIVNKIYLDGYQTKIIGMYYIDDGTNKKKDEAKERANKLNLPLTILKKN